MKAIIYLVLSSVILFASCLSSHDAGSLSDSTPPRAKVTAPKLDLHWESSGIVVNPKSDESHTAVSIKDPTIVFNNGEWHIYATLFDTKKNTWNMVYLHFADWADADSAEIHYMDTNPKLRGYKCAPQVFYFEPEKKWYLIYQSQQPTYSTAEQLGGPENWSAPAYFYRGKPEGAPDTWIDYWMIREKDQMFLFFSGDDGKLYRSQTRVSDFPEGFSDVTTVMDFPQPRELFEAVNVYKIDGMDRYLLLNECASASWSRYFKGFISDSLDGTWYEFGATETDSFIGGPGIKFQEGVSSWTRNFSHGEMLRSGVNEYLTINPENLQYLFQGDTGNGSSYELIPWSLGLLTVVPKEGQPNIFDVDLSTLKPYEKSE